MVIKIEEYPNIKKIINYDNVCHFTNFHYYKMAFLEP